ncbi:MAG TPA: 16S rRNA (guanine(527)-N(7))-methyltransferase RsmG [Tepidisphaeraceae bacterium]|nr:16S rRNA (guanine(527)-N(7))-methyltransferase RsmG [Tepidisphaeraceae bacterium]
MNPLWTEIAARAGAMLTPPQHDQLSRYLELLFSANQRMNLTRIIDREAAEVHHVGDALTMLGHIPPGKQRVADVGSGGGVPGVPLAIARPDLELVLIESTKKKALFLKSAAGELGLSNVHVSDARAEDVGRDPKWRESFDVVVVRAVGTLNWLAEWCLPLVKRGGRMLAMKGPKAAEELPAAEHAIRLVGGGSPDVHPANLPGADNHVIIEIAKTDRTPKAYPRPASIAKGKPL